MNTYQTTKSVEKDKTQGLKDQRKDTTVEKGFETAYNKKEIGVHMPHALGNMGQLRVYKTTTKVPLHKSSLPMVPFSAF